MDAINGKQQFARLVAAGAVLAHEVEPFTIVANLKGRPIDQRRNSPYHMPDYRTFLG